ncbi:MAG: 1-(5-phosphoribosyl)-5-((5-phosphoribosylamino)methylideneamino)imidazole-4-carboxamide isomerase [Deltaproteobacteria bacterium]|nr:1-(5-phosphoribosyl)-5-((5-phosphoribosylamino)methylideneamino)imidazole-4-carboxamide isomerase [Deltaproteobacteria bacterium]
MRALPAIDLLDGKVVRLRRGRYEDVTVYRHDAVATAREMVAAGARHLHVVDLEAARGGRPQLGVLDAITSAVGRDVALQVGGGLRGPDAVEARVAAGASRVVLGTAAIRDEAFVRDACARWPGRIVVAVDAREGRVAIDGWATTADVGPVELARRAAAWGAGAVLFTAIARDGMGDGPDVEATLDLARSVSIDVLASGGVGSLDHVRALAAAPPIAGVVVGRALYEGAFSIAELLLAAGDTPMGRAAP